MIIIKSNQKENSSMPILYKVHGLPSSHRLFTKSHLITIPPFINIWPPDIKDPYENENDKKIHEMSIKNESGKIR